MIFLSFFALFCVFKIITLTKAGMRILKKCLFSYWKINIFGPEPSKSAFGSEMGPQKGQFGSQIVIYLTKNQAKLHHHYAARCPISFAAKRHASEVPSTEHRMSNAAHRSLSIPVLDAKIIENHRKSSKISENHGKPRHFWRDRKAF